MILIDTSVWIMIFKDKSGIEAERVQTWLDGREVFLTRFNQLELLQGCRDEKLALQNWFYKIGLVQGDKLCQ